MDVVMTIEYPLKKEREIEAQVIWETGKQLRDIYESSEKNGNKLYLKAVEVDHHIEARHM